MVRLRAKWIQCGIEVFEAVRHWFARISDSELPLKGWCGYVQGLLHPEVDGLMGLATTYYNVLPTLRQLVNEFDRDVALDRLNESGARIVTLEMVAFEWMRHCKHPQFRNIQALIK